MNDKALLAAVRADLNHLRERGYPQTAQHVADLAARFETLTEAHRLLAEREERLTAEIVTLRP